MDFSHDKTLFGRLPDLAIIRLGRDSLDYTTSWHYEEQDVACLQNDALLQMKVFQGLCAEYNRPFVIDVGAHIGTYSIAASIHENLRGWALEPNDAVFAHLKHNLALNGTGNRIIPLNMALSNVSGQCTLNVPSHKTYSELSCLGHPNFPQYTTQIADLVSLDELMARGGSPSVDIIRIDTEGSEMHVLLGAAETINRHKPDLLLTYNWFKAAQSEIYGINVQNYLGVLGYQTTWVGEELLLCRHPGRNLGRSATKFAGWGANSLKIAMVKQKYDDFGPWQNVMHDPQNPLAVLQKWPNKYTYFEMTQLYKADWYVIPYCHDSRISRQKIKKYRQEIDQFTQNLSSIDDLPFDDYDIVISLDPVLRPLSASRTVFSYLQNEHHDGEYRKSLKQPLHGYDLFLDHMMEAPSCIYSLPQALAYPYTRAPATVRALRSKNQYDSIWIDNRFVMMLSHGNEACHHAVNERVLHNLGRELGVSFRFKHAAFDNIHQLQTPLAFMQELSENKYYVNLIACGAGQGLCDAASLGLICFGTPRLSYHRAICHPNCLCNDLTDFKRKFDQVAGSVNLQEEIRAWQDLMLADRMVRQPLHLLETAVEMKRSSAIRSGHPRHALPSCTITPLSADEEMSEIGKINYVKVQNIARSEYEKNNFAAIADHCKQALFFNESDVETYFLLACAYYGAGDSITALEWLDKSKNIDKAYKPVDQLICLIGAEFIHTNYADHLEAHNQSFNRLKKYIDSTVIGQIDDFDLQHAGYYDEIVDDLVTKIPKGENYETHRIILYHLRKQLKSVVAAERAQGATNLRLGT